MAAEFSQGVSDGLLRQRLFEKSTFPKTLHFGAKQEVQNIPLKTFQDSLSSWSDRVLSIRKVRRHDAPQ